MQYWLQKYKKSVEKENIRRIKSKKQGCRPFLPHPLAPPTCKPLSSTSQSQRVESAKSTRCLSRFNTLSFSTSPIGDPIATLSLSSPICSSQRIPAVILAASIRKISLCFSRKKIFINFTTSKDTHYPRCTNPISIPQERGALLARTFLCI